MHVEQMSYEDFSGRGAQATPAWAQRMNEPLVPTLDLPALKRQVQANLKELQKASEGLAKLVTAAKKKGQSQPPAVLVELSAAAREHARDTSRRLREAVGQVAEGSAEHKAVSALSEEFRQALLKFQQQVEATAHLVGPAGGAAPAVSVQPPINGGGLGGLGGTPTGGNPGGALPPDDLEANMQQQQQQQQQHIETNEAVLRERERGIAQLNHSVQEVSEIFQDLALLVNEQGQQIDNIQSNIESAGTNVDRGVQELSRAARHQRRTRSRMCLIAICVLVVIIVLVLILRSQNMLGR